MKALLTVLSAATCLVSAWMFTMYFVLRHPGYLEGAALAAFIFAGAAVLLAARPEGGLRVPIALWALAVAAIGAWALVSPGNDGWVLVAGALFICEGLAALMTVLPAALKGLRYGSREQP